MLTLPASTGSVTTTTGRWKRRSRKSGPSSWVQRSMVWWRRGLAITHRCPASPVAAAIGASDYALDMGELLARAMWEMTGHACESCTHVWQHGSL